MDAVKGLNWYNYISWDAAPIGVKLMYMGMSVTHRLNLPN